MLDRLRKKEQTKETSSGAVETLEKNETYEARDKPKSAVGVEKTSYQD